MLLADELSACRCELSPDDFRAQLIARLEEEFPGKNIDDLVCTPTDSLAYCNHIRSILNAPGLHDAVILKPLMNIRKRKDCPTNLKSSGVRRYLRKELKNAGCKLWAGAFRTLVVDCLADMYRNRTIDSVVCHPNEAAKLCGIVRTRSGCANLGDTLILSTLMNVRKAGQS